MDKNEFSSISDLAESFCSKCFQIEKDYKLILVDLDKIIKLVKKYNNEMRELIYVFLEKGARNAFLKSAHLNILTGKKATEGITAEGEFSSILEELKHKYTGKQIDIVDEIFVHLLSEVENLGREINVTTTQAFNFIDNTYAVQEESINKQFANLNKSITDLNNDSENRMNEYKEEIRKSEKKIYETSIAVLGIFSAAVLTFNAGAGLYSSILDAFSNSSIYKVLTILLIVGIILTGVLLGLFRYLEVVRKGSYSQISSTPLNREPNNISGHKEDSTTIKKSFWDFLKIDDQEARALKPFLITITILLCLLLCVFVFWELGFVENRNDRILQSSSLNEQKPTPETTTETVITPSIPHVGV